MIRKRRQLVLLAERGLMPTLVAVDMFQSGGLFRAMRRLNAD